MKKIVFLLVAAIAAGAVSAQKPFTFGPKVGINVTDLHPDGLDDINHLSGTKPALVIGAFAEYRAAKWFAVSLDVLYSRQGSSAEITQGALGSEHKLKFNNRLNYLNIPILANFYVTNGLALKAGSSRASCSAANTGQKSTAAPGIPKTRSIISNRPTSRSR